MQTQCLMGMVALYKNSAENWDFNRHLVLPFLGIVLRDNVLWANVRKYNSPAKPD